MSRAAFPTPHNIVRERLPTGYLRVGCFMDDRTMQHAVPHIAYNDRIPKEDRVPMTPEVCFDFCKGISGTQFMGLLNGWECMCSTWFIQSEGGHGLCDQPCEGDPKHMCGGNQMLDVYSVHQCPPNYAAPSPSPAPTTALLSGVPAFVATDRESPRPRGHMMINLKAGCSVPSMPESGTGHKTTQALLGKHSDRVLQPMSRAAFPTPHNIVRERLPTGYLRVGCFMDDRTMQHAVPHIAYNDRIPKEDRVPMTPEVCFDFCKGISGTQFMGLLNGWECMCSTWFIQSEGGHGLCDQPCEGDPKHMCGGNQMLDVYSVHQCPPNYAAPSPSPAPTTALLSGVPAFVATDRESPRPRGHMMINLKAGCSVPSMPETSTAQQATQALLGKHSGRVVQPMPGGKFPKPYNINENRVPTGYLNMGCFMDDPTLQRVVPHVAYNDRTPKPDRVPMTVEVCFGFCKGVPGAQFMGLLNGWECFCSTWFDQSTGGHGMCDQPCEGDPTNMCGGNQMLDVYSLHECPSSDSSPSPSPSLNR